LDIQAISGDCERGPFEGLDKDQTYTEDEDHQDISITLRQEDLDIQAISIGRYTRQEAE